MSKKHFIELADIIREHNRIATNRGEPGFGEQEIQALAKFCASQNYRFNWTRWISYIKGECGPSGGDVKPEQKPADAAVH